MEDLEQEYHFYTLAGDGACEAKGVEHYWTPVAEPEARAAYAAKGRRMPILFDGEHPWRCRGCGRIWIVDSGG